MVDESYILLNLHLFSFLSMKLAEGARLNFDLFQRDLVYIWDL